LIYLKKFRKIVNKAFHKNFIITMPYRFRFRVGHQLLFQCEVPSRQCRGHSKSGARCRRRVIIGFEYCFQHLKSERHLTIRPSTLPGAGKGLFAYDPRNPNGDAVVFGPNFPSDNPNVFERSRICIYRGRLITNDELEEHYGEYTAPYAVRLNDDDLIDSAPLRGVGSLANQGTVRTNNARLTVYNHAPLHDRARILANRPIRNGDEILIDYGDEYNMNEHNVTYSTLPR